MAGRASGKRTVYTFAFLYAGASRSLDRAKRDEEGSYYEIINALVLAAFTLEAYCNHLLEGDELDIELLPKGKDSIWAKYKHIRKALGIPGAGIENDLPWAARALRFRNLMAHGRTASIEFEEVTTAEPRTSDAYGSVEWEDFVNVELASKALEDVEKCINDFNERAGGGPGPLYCLASGSLIFAED